MLKIFKAFQRESNNNNNMEVKEKWELETNIIIIAEKWEEAFKSQDGRSSHQQ